MKTVRNNNLIELAKFEKIHVSAPCSDCGKLFFLTCDPKKGYYKHETEEVIVPTIGHQTCPHCGGVAGFVVLCDPLGSTQEYSDFSYNTAPQSVKHE